MELWVQMAFVLCAGFKGKAEFVQQPYSVKGQEALMFPYQEEEDREVISTPKLGTIQWSR